MKPMMGVVAILMTAAVVARADDDLIAKGRKLVEDSKPKCSMCHQVDGKGGKMGKPMEQLVADYSDEFLKGSLLEPKKTLKPDTKMPAYKYSDEEIAAVIAYMKSLKK
jgi:mono/diheme cytochrome c family protein